MSSYKQPYTPTHYNEYIPTLSAEDFKMGIQIKQQQFDQGWKTLQDSVNKSNEIDLFRPEDREYLNQRQSEIIANINKYSNLDLGDARNVYQLTSQIAPLYKDKRILDAAEDTGKINLLQKNIQELEKSHPDRYATINKNRDLRAIQNYLDTPNSRYSGSTTPTIYTDYDKVGREVVGALKPNIIDTPEGKRISEVDYQRIRQSMPKPALDQMDLELVESGVLSNDPNKIKTELQEKILSIEERNKSVNKGSSIYANNLSQIEYYNKLLKVDDQTLTYNWNLNKKEEFYKEHLSGLAYGQEIASPEAIKKQEQNFQWSKMLHEEQSSKDLEMLKRGYNIDINKEGEDRYVRRADYDPTTWNPGKSKADKENIYEVDVVLENLPKEPTGKWVPIENSNIILRTLNTKNNSFEKVTGIYRNQDGTVSVNLSTFINGKKQNNKDQQISFDSIEEFRAAVIANALNKPIGKRRVNPDDEETVNKPKKPTTQTSDGTVYVHSFEPGTYKINGVDITVDNETDFNAFLETSPEGLEKVQ
jgi:hypothetical protein